MWSSRSILSLHFPSDSFWLLFFSPLALALCDCDFAHEKQTKPENVALHTKSIMFTYILKRQLYSQSYIYIHIYIHIYLFWFPCSFEYIGQPVCVSFYLPYYWHAAYLVAGLVTLPGLYCSPELAGRMAPGQGGLVTH